MLANICTIIQFAKKKMKGKNGKWKKNLKGHLTLIFKAAKTKRQKNVKQANEIFKNNTQSEIKRYKIICWKKSQKKNYKNFK